MNTTGALSATAGAGFAALGMDATANSISLGATGTMVLDNALLTATGGIAATGSALSASAADMSGTGISLITATGGIAVDGAVLNASGLLQLDAAGNVALDDATLGGALLLLTADGSIANAGTTGSITADGAAISAGGSVNLANMTLTVGTGAAPGVSEDISLLADLAADGLAPTSATPNLHIAAGSVTLGDLVFNGDHLVVKADTLVFAGTVATSQADTLVQLAPLDATASISLVQSGSGTGTVNYSNTAHLVHFQGDTIALGTSGHSGPITIGEDGATIDIGASNLFVVTTAPVTGLDLVLSTGIVKDTNAVVVISDDFETPQSEEIDVNQDSVQALNDEYALDESGGSDEEEEGDEEGEDTDTDAEAEAEDDSLIRQDTVDEEMMCS